MAEGHALAVQICCLLCTQRAIWAGRRCLLLADLNVFSCNDLTGKPGFNFNRARGTQPAAIISPSKGNV